MAIYSAHFSDDDHHRRSLTLEAGAKLAANITIKLTCKTPNLLLTFLPLLFLLRRSGKKQNIMYPCELKNLVPVPEAVDVEAWSSSGWMVCRRTLSISVTSMHWLSSFFSSASRCCVEIFSLAKRSISCSYSFSFRFRVFKRRHRQRSR